MRLLITSNFFIEDYMDEESGKVVSIPRLTNINASIIDDNVKVRLDAANTKDTIAITYKLRSEDSVTIMDRLNLKLKQKLC